MSGVCTCILPSYPHSLKADSHSALCHKNILDQGLRYPSGPESFRNRSTMSRTNLVRHAPRRSFHGCNEVIGRYRTSVVKGTFCTTNHRCITLRLELTDREFKACFRLGRLGPIKILTTTTPYCNTSLTILST